jgi:pyruvate carboxylase
VFFQVNGLPRTVEVVDRNTGAEAASAGVIRSVREKSDPLLLGSVGAPMTSEVIEVRAKPGKRCPRPLLQ